jgi:hypothetical protein
MFKKTMFISIFLFVLNVAAQTTSIACFDPFSGEQTQFQLTEDLSGDPTQAVYKLEITPDSYLKPDCVRGNKVINLYVNNGKNIHSFSDEQIGTPGWGPLFISDACTGQVSFAILPNYQIPGIGSVSPSDNRANLVILRNNQSQIIAQASKRLVQESVVGGKAIWDVTNNAGLSPQVISYLLALKDNALFACEISAPTTTQPGLSAIATIGIAAAIIIPATIGIIVYISRYYPKCLKRPTGDEYSNQLQEQS